MPTPPRKKVLYLITKSNWGGAQRYVYDLATSLDTDQWEPAVALGGNGTLSTMLEHARVPTIPLPDLERDISLKKELRFFFSLYKLLRKERPDVLHLNSSKAGGVGALAGRLARVPNIIFTAHGWAFNEDRPGWQKFIIKFAHWLTVLLSHRTIAVSRALVEQMDWPWAERKMKVINPGRTIGVMYSPREAREKICDFFPRLSPFVRDPWIVCVAELHPIKRHDVLFRAFAEVLLTHPKARLICIGDGSERTRLQDIIASLNLESSIFLVGTVPEAARFLKAFDMLVLASKSESYGYVLHEAGLAHVPVVATAVGGVLDIVTDGESGTLVPPDDSPALAVAISKYLGNPTLATQHADVLHTALSGRDLKSVTARTCFLY